MESEGDIERERERERERGGLRENLDHSRVARALAFRHCATPRITGGVLDARERGSERDGDASRVFKRR